MKPINFDKAACNPISSNCVIWQGPDIPCISLCNGDSISTTVAELAKELCKLLDQLDVANYDLSCFGVENCAPENFNALVQFLIAQICTLINPGADGTSKANDCPDCMITVASCFEENGNTSLNIVDYISKIATKVCTSSNEINTINTTLEQYDIRIAELEDAGVPAFELPPVTAPCVPGISGAQPMDVVLNAFFNTFFCDLYQSLGTITQIGNAITPSCITFGSYNSIITGTSGWISAPTTLAESVKNIWTAICAITNQPPPTPAPGKSGRGVAVFVGTFSGVATPTQPQLLGSPTDSDFITQYANQEGFTVNFISGNNQLKPGDIWIKSCGT